MLKIFVELGIDADTIDEAFLRAEEFLTRAVTEYRKEYNVKDYELLSVRRRNNNQEQGEPVHK